MIFCLSIYILAKGLEMAGESGRLEQTAARACLPAITYSGGRDKESWLSVIAGEIIPLYTYWKEKAHYLSEETEYAELTVREEETRTQVQEEKPANETEPETEKKKRKEKKKEKKKETQGGETQGETEGSDKARQKAAELDMDAMKDFELLIQNYYTVDMSTTADPAQINAESLLGPDMTMKGDSKAPQILIYHTHSQEAFIDSVEGDTSTTIVGMGEYLAQLLTENYGYNVIHDTSVFDMVDGQLDRNTAYTLAAEKVSRILEENPSVEVVIDLHRDGLDGQKMVTEINGKQTAKIMFFNGLSRTARNGIIDYLPNPYISDNLAFSFQLQCKAREYYPDFTRPIYLQSLRYNLHMKPKSLLIEAGSQLNTVEEERNAMEPLADILDMVLQGE